MFKTAEAEGSTAYRFKTRKGHGQDLVQPCASESLLERYRETPQYLMARKCKSLIDAAIESTRRSQRSKPPTDSAGIVIA